MKSLEELKKESGEINLQIRKLLLNNYRLDDGIAKQLTIVATITTLREQLVKVQREIRVRFPDSLE